MRLPIIPQYNRQIGEAAPVTVRQQATATPDAYGAGVAQAIGQAGKVLDVVADRMDTAAVITAENELRKKTMEYMHGNLFKRQGLAAKGADADFDKEYQNYMSEMGKGLSGRAKQIFSQRAQQYQTSLYPKVQEHIHQQTEIASNEAIKGAIYADVQELFMLDPAKDEAKILTILQRGDADIAAARAGKPADYIKMQQAERRNLVLSGKLNIYKDLGQTAEAEQFIEKYGKFMAPQTVAPYQAWIQEKKKDNSLILEADSIAAAAGGDYDKARALINQTKGGSVNWQGIKAAAEKQFSKEYALGGDGTRTTDCGLFTLQVFQENGIDLKSRDVSEQARIMNEAGKFHNDKSRLKPGDLVFYKNTYEPAEGHGFGNITHAGIYAGNGKIIHAGSTKDENGKTGPRYADMNIADIAGFASVGGGSADPAYKEKLEAKVFARMNRDKQIKASRDHDELVRVQNEIASTDDPVKQLEIIKSSNLEARFQKDLQKHVTDSTKLKESDATAYTELLALKIDGKLTPEKVSQYGAVLTRKDYFSFLGESLELAKKSEVSAEKQANNVADKAWQTAVDAAGGLKHEKDALTQSISYRLDEQKLKGDARRVEALKLIEQDKKTKGVVFKQVTQDKDKWNWLEQSWDKREVALIRASNVSPQVAEQILMSVDRNDPLQQLAIDTLIKEGKVITKETINTAMIRLANERFPYKNPFEMK